MSSGVLILIETGSEPVSLETLSLTGPSNPSLVYQLSVEVADNQVSNVVKYSVSEGFLTLIC